MARDVSLRSALQRAEGVCTATILILNVAREGIKGNRTAWTMSNKVKSSTRCLEQPNAQLHSNMGYDSEQNGGATEELAAGQLGTI